MARVPQLRLPVHVCAVFLEIYTSGEITPIIDAKVEWARLPSDDGRICTGRFARSANFHASVRHGVAAFISRGDQLHRACGLAGSGVGVEHIVVSGGTGGEATPAQMPTEGGGAWEHCEID